MKEKIKLGVVCLSRKTFDYQAALNIYKSILIDLHKLEQVEIVAIEDLVIEPINAEAAGKFLYNNNVDGIAVISGTFHLGHLILEIKKQINKPMLLWGLDELPYNGGKIRLNSVCGVNLNASNLVKSGYNDFCYQVGGAIDENFVNALRMIRKLKNTRLGILGYHAQGFFNIDVDDLAVYRKFGIIIDNYELSEVYKTDFTDGLLMEYKDKILKTFNVSGITSTQADKVAELTARFKIFMDKHSLTALAVRCWPEFAAGFGISPCAAMSILQSEGYIMACEGDIDCAITMIAHSAAGAVSPFMADLSQVNLKEDFALMWHCGVAPCNLTDGKCVCSLDTYFAGGKGVTADFVMKDGTINIARLDSINGKYRLFLEDGNAIYMAKELRGTYAKVRFNKPLKAVLDKVVFSGVAHHVSMVYGDYNETFRTFAKLMEIEVL